ncbi:MAG TPA: exodeoxyribonuclease III [Bacteroidales bacterium]|mgnify:FL=1|jgi:exodeoxyribonuclease-3|nr:exodeoxyribonuclease III [Bacteroidales bacterium]HOX73526.1 exodeoxyribonuclease III [Bacteroidales bacterium]HQM69217.1 exodeoxyribonuclease III [Bacteroidales bacterium]
MKLVSWNINGIRAITKKSFFTDLERLDAEIICLQETKANDEQVREALVSLDGSNLYTNSAERPGYSGTAVISKIKPLNVIKNTGIKEFDSEGRVLCLEFDWFFLVNVYVPNSGSELARLAYRQEWDKTFLGYLKGLEKIKPVVVCGDLNVAHKAIDLARPKENYNKAAGYMQEEIDGMDRLTASGLTDTFRHFYPDAKGRYSWWSFRAAARSKNIGWRIDYFLVSSSFLPKVKDAFIIEEMTGSDHCPVGIIIEP